MNYLRDGDLLCPDDARVQKELLKEARFYQIQGIIDLLERKLTSSRNQPSYKVKATFQQFSLG